LLAGDQNARSRRHSKCAGAGGSTEQRSAAPARAKPWRELDWSIVAWPQVRHRSLLARE